VKRPEIAIVVEWAGSNYLAYVPDLPEFLRNLSRKMLGYALGRENNRVDLCVVQD
jgi:hypothetical protein